MSVISVMLKSIYDSYFSSLLHQKDVVTDRLTDGRTFALLELLSQLKMANMDYVEVSECICICILCECFARILMPCVLRTRYFTFLPQSFDLGGESKCICYHILSTVCFGAVKAVMIYSLMVFDVMSVMLCLSCHVSPVLSSHVMSVM